MRFFKYSDKSEEENKSTPAASETSESFSPFWVKIICVISAILVWFYVAGDKSVIYEKEFKNIKIEYTNMGAIKEKGFDIINGGNFMVDVGVSGIRRDVNSIKSEDLVATVDLSGIYSSGEHSVKVNVKTPKNSTNVTSVFPSEIILHVDKSSSKNLSVSMKAHNISTKESQTTVAGYTFSASQVAVSGPEADINKIEHAVVECDFSGERIYHGYKLENVKIKLLDAENEEINNPYVTIKPTETDVTVNLAKDATVKIKPEYSGNFDFEKAGFSQTVEPKTVKIRGIPEIINGITEIKTSTISAEDIGDESEYSTTASLVIPSGVQLKENQSREVTVNLKRDVEKKKLNVKNIIFLNCPEGLEAFTDTEIIEAELRGTREDIQKLNSDNMYFVANLSGAEGEGTYENIELKAECFGLDILKNGSVSVDGEYTCTVVLKSGEEISADDTAQNGESEVQPVK